MKWNYLKKQGGREGKGKERKGRVQGVEEE